uniref:Uncharacterized protein n=1 Tax=Periophthalmus magnuspinnatus TaxID=409849 RepID=A0A3B3ZV02_9GOBI
MVLTHSSILFMSVSSSHGFTSRRIDDFAMTAGKLTSSSEPNRSRSSSSSSSLLAAGTLGTGFFTPGRLDQD